MFSRTGQQRFKKKTKTKQPADVTFESTLRGNLVQDLAKLFNSLQCKKVTIYQRLFACPEINYSS